MLRRSCGPALLAAIFAMVSLGTVAAAPPEAKRTYIVTLSVTDAGKALRTAVKRGRQRMRRRAARTTDTTNRLQSAHGFQARHRYTSAISGFSARLTPHQAARIARDPNVAEVRPARRFRISSQVLPVGMTRTRATLSGGPRPDVDVDIAVLDTGIGPVGGNELNVQGGLNCSGDGLDEDAWEDLFPSRHGTHVAGIAAARDNGVGAIGVAPGARLWSVRVFRATGYGDESTIICGLDWVVATRSGTPPAGSRPIDVINMSIQGPRVVGQPEECGVGGDGDPIHVAVCSAYAAGITTVVAAGNDAGNAAAVSPAGYDQAITVGAINDYDGRDGERANSDCGFQSGEKDDHYASYSNWGGDVDIVAPGTCVVSTYPSADGDATQRLTGTSMATPHVTGAVARYLATHPGTSPETMRRLVRAAGRLNWELKSDPDYSGVSDSNAPHRLLDVRALMGGTYVRPWIFPAHATMGGDTTSRRFRLDVQRYGGYSGDLTLEVTGLPGDVATASYDPGATLSGLSGLGTTMTLALQPNGADFDGTVRIRAEGPAGVPAGGRDLHLLVDQTGPRIDGPRVRVVGGRRALGRGSKATVRVAWSAKDSLTKVKRNALERRIGNRPWKHVAGGPSRAHAQAEMKPGRSYRFRVRSTDTLGNQSTAKVALRLSVRDSASARIVRPAGGWSTKSSPRAIGGSLLSSNTTSAALLTTFDGVGVAIVAPLGPTRGKIRVRIDGGAWTSVDLNASRFAPRRVVYSRKRKAGVHTVEIRVQSGAAAIDALIITR
jgi:subtilisin family serine protease